MNLIYKATEAPKSLKELLLYALQQMLSILTATILISTICGTNVAAGLVAAGLSTLSFLCLTGFKVPLFLSNSGATVSAVIGALALSNQTQNNYTAVILGGLTICVMNTIFAIIIKKIGTSWIHKVLPPVLVGTIIMAIGINLMGFIPTYMQLNGGYSLLGISLGLLTLLFTAVYSHYGKGMVPTLAFLLGICSTYLICILLTYVGIPLVDFSQFDKLFAIPDFAFLHLNFADFDWSTLPQIIIMFACVNAGAVTEHIGDLLTCEQITGEKIVDKVGMHKTLLADGIGDLVGSLTCGCPTTTYGESLATIAASRVASTRVIATAAVMTILLGFIQPFNAAIVGMPQCLFGGLSLLAYGYISLSGIKVLISNKINFDKPKNMIIFAATASLSISGLVVTIGSISLSGVSLGIIVGIILNILLKD